MAILQLGTPTILTRNQTFNGEFDLTTGRLRVRQIANAGAPTVALAGLGAGNVNNGSHGYRVTFVTATQETGLGTEAGVTVVDLGVNGQVALTAIPVSANPAVTSRRIYRTAAGNQGVGPWLLLTTIADNSTTVFTDNVADAGLGAAGTTTNSTGSIDVDGNLNVDGDTTIVTGTATGRVTITATTADYSLRVVQNGAGLGIQIGTTATSRGLTGNVLMVSGAAEVDGMLWADGGATIGGAGIVTDTWSSSDNATNMTANLPVTGVDAGAHNARWQIDGINWISASATGNGAGSVGPISVNLGQASPGAATATFNSVLLDATYATENQIHRAFRVQSTQNGTNTTTLSGISIAMSKITGATTLGTMIGAEIIAPTVAGTVTTNIGLDVGDQSPVGGTSAFAIRIASQTANATTTRAIELVGTTRANAIRFGSSANMYGAAANQLEITDATDVNGFLLTVAATASQSIRTVSATTGTIVLQDQTFTAGATHNAITMSPIWVAEDQIHRAVIISPTQNGANSTTLVGFNVSLTKATGATTLALMTGGDFNTPAVTGTATATEAIRIANQSIAGSTTSFGINILSQTANATTTRAIEIAGTGVNNAIRFGASANLYGVAANQLQITDATNVNGFLLTVAATASQSIRTVSTTTGSVLLQDQTFTAGAVHNAVSITPIWVAENFAHYAVNISPTQNGTNSSLLAGAYFSMNKATAATTLTTMTGIIIDSPAVVGTVSNSFAMTIGDQATPGITTPRGIQFDTTGVANSIVWGSSALQYANAANNIRFMNATNARGIDFTLTAAGDQTLGSTAGNLVLAVAATSEVILSSTIVDIPSNILEMNNLVQWDTGVAITAAAYQVGRDADGTNQMHFNVPTGATMEWSVNDVSVLSLSSTIVQATGSTGSTMLGGVSHQGGALGDDAIVRAFAVGGSADAYMVTGLNAGQQYAFGLDNSDSDAWVLSVGVLLGAANTNAIRLSPAADSRLTLQERTFTAGATHDVVSILPTWTTENFVHNALLISTTQNGANSASLSGLTIQNTKATAATVLAVMTGISLETPIVTGTVTENNAIDILTQTVAGITTSRAINIRGQGASNSIVLGGSPLIYSPALEAIRFMDSTNVRGIEFNLTAAGAQTIGSVAGNLELAVAATIEIILSATNVDVVSNTLEMNNLIQWDTGAAISATVYQVGRDVDATNQMHFNVPTGATFEFSVNDVAQMTLSATAVNFLDNSITTTGGGSLTGTWTSLGIVTTIDINGGTIDGVTIGGAVAGAITGTTITVNTSLLPDIDDGAVLGASGNAFSDLFLASGGVINWSAGDVTLTHSANLLAFAGASLGYTFDAAINSSSTGNTNIRLQSQTFTPGGIHQAVIIEPIWTAENFTHIGLSISATQNGANTQTLIGTNVAMTKATAATTLAIMTGLNIDSPAVTGTVTNSYAISLSDQGTAGAGARGIRFVTTGVANSIVWGDSALQYGASPEVIGFRDSTNVRGINFTMTAAGNQTIATTAGALQINGAVRLQDTITNYGNQATAGRGIAAILASGQQLAIGTNGTTVATYTAGAADELVEVGGFVEITAYTSGNGALALDYTTARGTVVTGINLFGRDGSNSLVNNLVATGHIRIKSIIIAIDALSTITLKTYTAAGTMTGDWYAYVKRIQ